jgi:16S rRNA processing protein RimM
MKHGRLRLGKINGAHGIRGVVTFFSYAESPDIFTNGMPANVIHPDGREEACVISWAKPHKKGLRMALENVDTIEKAKTLVGCELTVERSVLPDLEEDAYYWEDVIGLLVYDMKDSFMGRVEAILRTGSNDVYVTKHGTTEILIPAIDTVVRDIDLTRGIMRVDMPREI